MKRLLLSLCLLASPALAEQPYDQFALSVAPCLAGAETDAAARACIGTASGACFNGTEDGQTTVGMTSCLMAEAGAWDALLNEEYARARNAAQASDDADRPNFPGYAVRAEQLRDAQRAWIAFRDANCAMEYGIYGAGTMRMIAGADCTLRMTAERTLDLRSYRQSLGDE